MAEPAVIDEDLCRRCITTLKTGAAGGLGETVPAADNNKKDDKSGLAGKFREARALLLSYKNIFKIDNLVGFERLVKLQLDNNIIEHIENLGHLTGLEWLDLSFNNISQITGLDSLVNLTNLSLFSNRITQLEGLDSLTKLQVLSVGNNLIGSLDSVMYLRRFTHLQAANFVGNPFAQEAEYRPYVLAHLKHLKYLDYRMVDEQAVTAAKEQYQEDLLDMEEREAKDQEDAEAAEAAAKRLGELREANLSAVEALKEELLQKGQHVELDRMRGHTAMAEPMKSFSDELNEAAEEYISLVMEQHKQKQAERVEFETALEEAKAEGATEAKVEIAAYGVNKRATLEAAGSDSAQLQQAVQGLEKANAALYETLMEQEMAQVERYAESINAFERSFDELSKKTQSATVEFFQKLRELEAAYTEKCQAGALELMEISSHADSEEKIDGLSEEARVFLGDKETVMNMLSAMRDGRVGKLDTREDELRQAEDRSLNAVTSATRTDEYTRNRTRVVEIWNHVRYNSDELEKIGREEGI